LKTFFSGSVVFVKENQTHSELIVNALTFGITCNIEICRIFLGNYLIFGLPNTIVIFVLSAQSDCFLLGHENEFLVETVRSRLQTHSNAPTKQSSCARNTNTIFSTTAF
jgi:hypothetical protein